MIELAINGRFCRVEQDGDELTIFGKESIEFVLPLIESGENFPICRPHYNVIVRFGCVIGYGTTNGTPYIWVKVVPER